MPVSIPEHYGRRVDPVELVAIAVALRRNPMELFAAWLDRLRQQPASSSHFR